LSGQITPEDLAEAEDVDFEQEKENWNKYKLKDGTSLMVKLVLVGVKRLRKWNPDGSPVYVINSQNVMRVTNVPKELKGKIARETTFKPV
jgi:hypothetical protein